MLTVKSTKCILDIIGSQTIKTLFNKSLEANHNDGFAILFVHWETSMMLNGCLNVVSSPQVISWIVFTGLFSYVKVVVSTLLHEAGHTALLWCGVFIQVGSLIGALTMFPLVSVYQVFQRAQDCVNSCS